MVIDRTATLDDETDNYPMPLGGWTCFHCGENFTTYGLARDHFGDQPEDGVACKIKVGEERGLVMELRRVQDKVRDLEDEVERLRERPAI